MTSPCLFGKTNVTKLLPEASLWPQMVPFTQAGGAGAGEGERKLYRVGPVRTPMELLHLFANPQLNITVTFKPVITLKTRRGRPR